MKNSLLLTSHWKIFHYDYGTLYIHIDDARGCNSASGGGSTAAKLHYNILLCLQLDGSLAK